jgi:putative FmdB family regulatory protein
MPIYEYSCRSCGNRFDFLLLGKEEVACPACSGKDLERLFSAPGQVKAGAVSDLAMRAAKKRDKAQGRERMEEQRIYEHQHYREEMGY